MFLVFICLVRIVRDCWKVVVKSLLLLFLCFVVMLGSSWSYVRFNCFGFGWVSIEICSVYFIVFR